MDNVVIARSFITGVRFIGNDPEAEQFHNGTAEWVSRSVPLFWIEGSAPHEEGKGMDDGRVEELERELEKRGKPSSDSLVVNEESEYDCHSTGNVLPCAYGQRWCLCTESDRGGEKHTVTRYMLPIKREGAVDHSRLALVVMVEAHGSAMYRFFTRE